MEVEKTQRGVRVRDKLIQAEAQYPCQKIDQSRTHAENQSPEIARLQSETIHHSSRLCNSPQDRPFEAIKRDEDEKSGPGDGGESWNGDDTPPSSPPTGSRVLNYEGLESLYFRTLGHEGVESLSKLIQPDRIKDTSSLVHDPDHVRPRSKNPDTCGLSAEADHDSDPTIKNESSPRGARIDQECACRRSSKIDTFRANSSNHPSSKQPAMANGEAHHQTTPKGQSQMIDSHPTDRPGKPNCDTNLSARLEDAFNVPQKSGTCTKQQDQTNLFGPSTNPDCAESPVPIHLVLDKGQCLTRPAGPYNQQPLTAEAQIKEARLACFRQIKLHLDILIAYHAHVLGYMWQDPRLARVRARLHWTETARSWESAIPASWKAQLPILNRGSSSTNNDVNIMTQFTRMIRVQVLMEKENHAKNNNSSIGKVELSSDDDGDDDDDDDDKDAILVAAFRGQVSLMMIWTEMFCRALIDLRCRFPLLVQPSPPPSPELVATNVETVGGRVGS